MRISATGTFKIINNSLGRGYPSRTQFMKSARGFTLIEIMLVLVLLALSSVAVISTLPTSKNHLAEDTARSIYERLQLINEEAVLSGVDYGLRVEQKQNPPTLTFMQLGEKGWHKVKRHSFNAETKIDKRLMVDFQAGGTTWEKDDDRLFKKDDSLFDDQMFGNEKDKKKKPQPPQIFILSNGETTPMVLSLYLHDQSDDDAWHIVVQDNGEILLKAPGEAITQGYKAK